MGHPRLTAKARDLEGPAINAARAQNDVVLSTLSEEEQADFLKLMGKAISAMKDSE